MSKNMWKDKYMAYDGSIIDTSTPNVIYISPIGSQLGDGSRDNPYSSSNRRINADKKIIICANGYNNISLTGDVKSLTGQNRYNTVVYLKIPEGFGALLQCKDITIAGWNSWESGTSAKNCIFDNAQLTGRYGSLNYPYYCLFKKKFINYSSGYNNVYKDIVFELDVQITKVLSSNVCIFEKCDILLSQTYLDNYKNNYQGFVSSRFKIGTETEYTALTGTTEEELRDNFKARCVAAGLTVPNVTDFGETLPMGRWVFANDGCYDGYILKGSVLDNFKSRRFLTYFGCYNFSVDEMPITIDESKANAFTPKSKQTGLAVSDGAITMVDDNFAVWQNNYIDSKLSLLGLGLRKFTKLDIVNNLPVAYGVGLNKMRSITLHDSDDIATGTNYLVRSNDENEAIVVYNGVTYSSSLLTRNNVFRGVEGKPTIDSKTDNAQIYEATDFANPYRLQMRVVRELPSDMIKTGNLLTGYWYFVSSDDVSSPVGTVQYKGVSYPFGSSFLVEPDDLTFIVGNEEGNNIHLRRGYKDNFDPNDQTDIDYQFWQGKQKPIWFDVLPEDLRCLMKNNKAYSDEMLMDVDGKYITSGHPDFYNKIIPVSGTPITYLPYEIIGKYYQVRIPVTTLNPM